ncbi:NPEPPS family protein [Megaselia abdita]
MIEFQRLPTNVKPTNYDIELKPDMEKFAFTGKISIKIEVNKTLTEITLNALEINIVKANLVKDDNSTLNTKSIKYSTENETVTLEFEEVVPQKATLNMHFNGILNDKMKGFYRSKYFTTNGEERHAAVTQFEATDARRCFPCWDEPAIKATFDISIVVPQNRVALSNMPVKTNELLDDDLQKLSFEKTPIMSTYLVAVVVGEFDFVEDKSSDGVTVRVYTPLGKKEQGLFALKVATKVLPYYNDYFKIAYPLPKMDLIAIADFSAGAMENWGLITYRETFVLVDPDNTSLIRKQSIALTVGHEIAHQWFGNLVTMEWWTHLWLNEGYASFVEFLCVNHLFPEYDIWTQFVTDMYTKALELDALQNSHPIEVEVGHPTEIDEIFDEISYNKGASIIRMLHNYLGDEAFRKGMNVYLTRHQYGNTSTENLWKALEEGSGSDMRIEPIMSTWVKQKGYPVISVSCKQHENKRHLKISQEKFIADGSKPDSEYFWMVPITISTAQDPSKIEKSFILETKNAEVVIDNLPSEKWIKLNPGTVSYYRTRYTTDMLLQFVPAIRDMTLPPLDRLGLIDDAFALVQAGQISTVDVLQLIDAYRNETNFTVWTAITNSLSKMQAILSHTQVSEKFNKYGQNLYAPVAEKLGWNVSKGEHHLSTLLRSLVLHRLISFSCDETIKEAKQRFEDHINGVNLLPADLRSVCYKAVLQTGDLSTFEQMLKLYRRTDLHEEKDRISRALGSITNIDLLFEVIKFAMSEEVRAQDAVFIIVAVALNPKGRDIAWNFFKENSETLLQKYQV